MVSNKVVTDGYIKLLALSVSHLMTEIVMEKNTNCQEDIDAFREKYGNIKSIIMTTKRLIKIFIVSIIFVILLQKRWRSVVEKRCYK